MNDHPIILFDGICNLCNGMVNFIIANDRKKVFRFAALQSPAGKKLIEESNPVNLESDSFILIDGQNIYQHSTAALKVYNKLEWYYKWTQIGWIFPRVFRDAVYKFIARNRYKWFGRKETCMVPGGDVRDRFL